MPIPPISTPLKAPQNEGVNQPWYQWFKDKEAQGAAATGSLEGLGTAARKNIGTSGGTVPLLNTANDWSKQQRFPLATLTEAEALEGWDLATKQTATLTMTSSFQLANAVNAKPGATYQLAVHAGVHVLTFGTMYKFPANGAVITTVGDCLFSLFCPSDGVLWCVGVKEFA
jgi:hypothetical protein